MNNKSDIFWQTYLNLEDEVLNLSKFIYFTDTTRTIDKTMNHERLQDNKQLDTFSPFIADLLVRCCVEIEAISKELYFENGGTKERGSSDIYFDTDCLALLNSKWHIANKEVIVSSPNFYFVKNENRVFTPLNKANLRSKVYWAKAYQAVKHDRYYNLHHGNIKALLQALGALYLLNIYNRDIKLTTKYLEVHKLDMSFGSKIFSLNKATDNCIDVINGKENTNILASNKSPYILKYTDASYHQIIETNKKCLKALSDYILSQPELKEQAFIKQIDTAQEREKVYPHDKVIITQELCKYRLNKKIPQNLPFEERKNLFIKTSEWNGRIRQQNNHKKENDLTEENLQAEIDDAGYLAGLELEQNFTNIKFNKAFVEGYCEIVLDKGNVKYN